MTERIVIKPEQNQEHFEQIWEASESLYTEKIASTQVSSIIRELQAKLSVYDSISSKEMNAGDKSKLQHNLLGKILMTFTQLSLKDNINVFAALKEAVEEKKMMRMEREFNKPTEPSPEVDKLFNELKDKISSSGLGGTLDALKEVLKAAGTTNAG